jgi:hypothetical protein
MSRKARHIPVRVHYYNKAKGNDGHLYFLCMNYLPYGSDPGYRGGKWHCESQQCNLTKILIQGAWFEAPWRCSKDGGSKFCARTKLPDEFTPKATRTAIAQGMRLLWRTS